MIIPRIDLSPAHRAITAEATNVSREIDLACREVGFFIAVGHGIGRTVVEDANAALKRFFSLTPIEKESCRIAINFLAEPIDFTPYGYSGLLEESALAYMGQLGRPCDYVEKFSAGRRILNDDEPLPFIEDEAGQDLRQKLKNYYVECQALSVRIAELLTLPLGVPYDYFSKRIDRANDSMRGHRYPPFSPDFANHQGMGEHCDGSLITLLTQTTPGIEVQARHGEWVTPQIAGTDEILVNIGDLMAAWTDGRYVSTPHKVVLTDRERQSIAFFKVTNDDVDVSPKTMKKARRSSTSATRY